MSHSIQMGYLMGHSKILETNQTLTHTHTHTNQQYDVIHIFF